MIRARHQAPPHPCRVVLLTPGDAAHLFTLAGGGDGIRRMAGSGAVRRVITCNG